MKPNIESCLEARITLNVECTAIKLNKWAKYNVEEYSNVFARTPAFLSFVEVYKITKQP